MQQLQDPEFLDLMPLSSQIKDFSILRAEKEIVEHVPLLSTTQNIFGDPETTWPPNHLTEKLFPPWVQLHHHTGPCGPNSSCSVEN